MSWLVRVRCTSSLSEPVSTLAVMLDTTGLSETADRSIADQVIVLVGFEAYADADRFAQSAADLAVESVGIESVDPADWEVSEPAHVEVDGTDLELEVGSAFGHGGHATTRLGLDALATLPMSPGQTLLDVGCGTGVLTLAAAVLGFTATGCDIDPGAVGIATRNATRNQLDEQTSFISATPTQLATPQGLAGSISFDVIIANTLIGVHESEANAVGSLSGPNTTLLLTGLLHEHVSRATVAYDGFNLQTTNSVEGWVLLTGCRR